MRRGVVAALFVGLLGLVPVSLATAEEASLTVTPFTDVVEGTEVAVQAEGPPVGFGAVLSVCGPDGDLFTGQGCANLLSSLGSNSIDTTFTARRFYRTGVDPVDCATAACTIYFVGVDDPAGPPAFLVGHPFDVRLEPESLSVVPATDLAEGQTLTATVMAPLFPNSGLGICATTAVLRTFVTAANQCRLIDLYNDTAGVTETFEVSATLVPELGAPIDCVAVGCEIVYAGAFFIDDSIAYTLRQPIDFGTPSFSVVPTAGLADATVVQVEAANRATAPGAAAVPVQCGLRSLDFAEFFCGPAGLPAPDFDGDYSGPFTVARFVPASDGGDPVDCAAPPGRCAVFLIVIAPGIGITDLAGMAISFSPP